LVTDILSDFALKAHLGQAGIARTVVYWRGRLAQIANSSKVTITEEDILCVRRVCALSKIAQMGIHVQGLERLENLKPRNWLIDSNKLKAEQE
jgi:hypothetical protein